MKNERFKPLPQTTTSPANGVHIAIVGACANATSESTFVTKDPTPASTEAYEEFQRWLEDDLERLVQLWRPYAAPSAEQARRNVRR